MKKLFTLLALIVITTINAQAPQGFNYQATVRNSAGELLLNQSVSFKFSILQNSDSGDIVYSENQTANTDDLGHIALVVGQGTATTGTFTNINWGSGTYYLGIELNTGTGYVAMGTTQLLSVPYALYANTAGSTSSNNTGLISPTITTNPVTNIIGTTATFSASISNVNINQLSATAGFVYSLNPNPIFDIASSNTGNELRVDLSSNTFSFDSAVQGYPIFSPFTLYYVRAFVITENNTIVYGNEISFITAEASSSQQTIVDVASSNADFSILVRALERTNLLETLDGSGQFTVFAPTNEAFTTFFNSLGAGVTVENVDATVLKYILLNHVIGSEINSADFPAASYSSTLSPINATATSPTISMFVQKAGSVVTINGGFANGGATVTTADLDASNGVIHVVDNVIAIPTLVNHVIANPDFDTLQAVVTSTGGALGDQSAVLNALVGLTAAAPATLFAPNNIAFANAMTGSGFAVGATPAQVTKVLQYHVTTAGNVRSSQLTNNQVVPMFTNPDQNVTVILGTGTVDIKDTANNLSRVFLADIQASNGVIHGVNRVLQPIFN
jgi:uncharacterized surface protein with fasciclin (FAS1) repeats